MSERRLEKIQNFLGIELRLSVRQGDFLTTGQMTVTDVSQSLVLHISYVYLSTGHKFTLNLPNLKFKAHQKVQVGGKNHELPWYRTLFVCATIRCFNSWPNMFPSF